MLFINLLSNGFVLHGFCILSNQLKKIELIAEHFCQNKVYNE